MKALLILLVAWVTTVQIIRIVEVDRELASIENRVNKLENYICRGMIRYTCLNEVLK